MTEERELNLKVKATADVRDLQEAVQATSSLLDQIKEAERLFKQHNQTSIQLKKAYKEFGSTGEYTADRTSKKLARRSETVRPKNSDKSAPCGRSSKNTNS